MSRTLVSCSSCTFHDGRAPNVDWISPSGTKLTCGIHSCQSKCHQLSDHSKMLCEQVMTSYCPNNHAQTWKCHQKQPLTCRLCDREAKLAAEKQQKDFELQKKRDVEQQAHDEKLAKMWEQLGAQTQVQKDLQLAREREAALKQLEQDLKDTKERLQQKVEAEKKRRDGGARAVEQVAASSSSIAATLIDTAEYAVNTFTNTLPKPSSPENTVKKEKEKESGAKSYWQCRKDIEGVANPHIDAIMEMIGLEPVKQQVLKIMDKVDVNVRQGTSLAKERFNVVFLGNPGTGIVHLFAQPRMLTDDTLQEKLPWRGIMPDSWPPWMFSLVINSWKQPEPSSETRESLVPRRWLKILSRPAEVVSSSMRHISSPLNTTTAVAKYWTTCWRRWRITSASSCSSSLDTASRWRSSSSIILDSRAAFLINSTSRTTKTTNCS